MKYVEGQFLLALARAHHWNALVTSGAYKLRRLQRGTDEKSPLVNVLRRACKAADLGFMVTAHGLRRTFNNEGRKVLPREVLKSITGHVTDKMTDHYSLVGAVEKSDAATAVGRVLRVVK